MKVTLASLSAPSAWEALGVTLPAFDVAAMREATLARPTWVHFGGGNIFRAFIAGLQQKLLNRGLVREGIIAADTFDVDNIRLIYGGYDNLTMSVTLNVDASIGCELIASVAEALVAQPSDADFSRLAAVFEAPSLQLASFTITEKGYALRGLDGQFSPVVLSDIENGPGAARHAMSIVTALLNRRYLAGGQPIAMVSMDNCSHNGDKLYAAVNAFAEKWCAAGLADKDFLAYVNDKTKVSFPWSMIDKITPRPDAKVEKIFSDDGMENLEPVITSKNTYIAPFVNAEECEYLVIEDAFPNGRPALDKGGIIFTDRETVDKVEKMKVCTCLNPLHTTLAVYGCLLGYTLIADEMKNPLLKKFVEKVGYVEGLPVVVDPGIIAPSDFIDTVVNTRIPNPFMPDTPQRIACDTSQKLPIRFGETIKAYEKSSTLDVKSLKFIPLVYAGWLRYLMAVDDKGNAFELSPDPLLDTVTPFVKAYELSDAPKDLSKLDELLKNDKIFGVDLCAIGMADTVKSYFAELSAGKGCVEKTLEKYLA